MPFLRKLAGSAAAIALACGGAAYVKANSAPDESVQREYADFSCYILKEHDGRIALFTDGKAEPVAVYSTPIEDINPADAVLLRDGIRLKSMAEVGRLIEDLDIE